MSQCECCGKDVEECLEVLDLDSDTLIPDTLNVCRDCFASDEHNFVLSYKYALEENETSD